jgi:hypothetical protein
MLVWILGGLLAVAVVVIVVMAVFFLAFLGMIAGFFQAFWNR